MLPKANWIWDDFAEILQNFDLFCVNFANLCNYFPKLRKFLDRRKLVNSTKFELNDCNIPRKSWRHLKRDPFFKNTGKSWKNISGSRRFLDSSDSQSGRVWQLFWHLAWQVWRSESSSWTVEMERFSVVGQPGQEQHSFHPWFGSGTPHSVVSVRFVAVENQQRCGQSFQKEQPPIVNIITTKLSIFCRIVSAVNISIGVQLETITEIG